MTTDRDVAPETARYPPADLSPTQFERLVGRLLEAVSPVVTDLTVRLHDTIEGVDGSYVFDATARFNLGGMRFMLVVEAKRHSHPIKRGLVQVLHDKLRSVGAQKAAMFATAPYQRGALEYAKTHGIALVTVTEGRFTFETRALGKGPALSREEARELVDLPPFAAHAYGPGDQPGSTTVTLLDPDEPGYILEALFGITPHGADS